MSHQRLKIFLWALLLALALSACQNVQPASQQPTRTAPDQPGQSPAAQKTAAASEPGSANNPYVVRAIDRDAKFYGYSEIGKVMTTKTQIVRDEFIPIAFNPAQWAQVLTQLSVDKGLVLWALGNSLTATPQDTLVQYWLVPYPAISLAGATYNNSTAVLADTSARSGTWERADGSLLTSEAHLTGCGNEGNFQLYSLPPGKDPRTPLAEWIVELTFSFRFTQCHPNLNPTVIDEMVAFVERLAVPIRDTLLDMLKDIRFLVD